MKTNFEESSNLRKKIILSIEENERNEEKSSIECIKYYSSNSRHINWIAFIYKKQN
jgi:hypothetical protein